MKIQGVPSALPLPVIKSYSNNKFSPIMFGKTTEIKQANVDQFITKIQPNHWRKTGSGGVMPTRAFMMMFLQQMKTHGSVQYLDEQIYFSKQD